MKLFAKIAVSVALAVSALVYSPKPAKADMFGVTDAALLVQQILQYLQDFDISELSQLNFSDLLDEINKKTKGLQKIVNIFENGQQGIQTFNNITEVSRNLIYTTQQVDYYMKYVGALGDDFDISRCYTIYKKFHTKTKLVFRQMERTIASLQKLQGQEVEGSDFLNMLDKVISGANATLNTISYECLGELKGEISDHEAAEAGARVNEINRRIII